MLHITKTFNLDDIANEINIKQNKKCSFILDHPYRIFIINGSWLGKTTALLNLITHQSDIVKIYLYSKDFCKPIYKLLITRREDAATKHLNDPNAFIECFHTMDGVYENIDDYNRSRK